MIEQLKSYPRSMWMLCFGMVISAIGESFLWPLTTMYITQVFHKPLTVAATALLLQAGGGFIGNVVGGILFDRWSGRKTIISAIICSITILILMGLCSDFYGYIVLLMMLGFCNGTFWPGTRALAVSIWPEGGRKSINAVYVANNVGVAIGAALGGFLASISFQWAFFGNAVSYSLFLVLFLKTIKEHHVQGQTKTKHDKGTLFNQAVKNTMGMRQWVSFSFLVIGLSALVITYVQWTTTIPTYIHTLGIPLSSYSMLWAVNGLVIVLCQPILSWMIHQFMLTLKTQIIIGAGLFTVAMFLVSSSTSYIGFVICMIIITLGEMLVWPGVPALAAEMAPEGRQGFFQGIVTSGQSAGRMIGPLLGSFLYENLSPHGMLSAMILLTVLSITLFFMHNRLWKSISTGSTAA